jgi:hypothetical protein
MGEEQGFTNPFAKYILRRKEHGEAKTTEIGSITARSGGKYLHVASP